MNQSHKGILCGVAAVAMWSTVATAFKVALQNLTPIGMLTIASTSAALIFAAWLTITRRWGFLRQVARAQWLRYAATGLLMPTTYYLTLFMAYDHLPAQIAQPVNYTWPILLVLLLRIMGRAHIPAWKFVGMAISLAGVTLISLGGSASGLEISLLGILFGVGSALLWAVYWLITDSDKGPVNEVGRMFLTFGFGAVYLWAASPFVDLGVIYPTSIGAGVYIGLFEMGIPFICFGIAIRQSGNPALVNQLCYLAPFISLFLVSHILGEAILPSTYTGLSLIVGGLIFNELYGRRLNAITNS